MGGPGSGRKKGLKRQAVEARARFEESAGEIAERIIRACDGGEMVCQNCGQGTGQHRLNMEAAKLVIEQALGKAPQRIELDVTHRVELSAGQCAAILERGRREHEAFLLPAGPGEEGDRAA